MARSNLGDVVLFNWSGSDFPNHAAVVTKTDSSGQPTHAFAGWEDTMTFHEVELGSYNGGVIGNIIGFGNLQGIVGVDDLEAFVKKWNGRQVAPDWNGYKGAVCIDAVTSLDGYGGEKLRQAILADYKKHPKTYRNYGAGEANPKGPMFFRRLAWLLQFLKNTNRFSAVRARK